MQPAQAQAPPQHTAAQTRVLDAAVDLFAEHGVSGTSLRMIADALGVTKAAIYFQFRTKEEIVLAAVGQRMAKLEWALDAAEAEPDPARAREFLLRQVIEICIERGRIMRALQNDPAMGRLLMEHAPFLQLFERAQRLLIGERPDPALRMRVAMLSGAIGAGVSHSLVSDLDDATIRAHLRELAQHLLPSFEREAERGGARRRRKTGKGTP